MAVVVAAADGALFFACDVFGYGYNPLWLLFSPLHFAENEPIDLATQDEPIDLTEEPNPHEPGTEEPAGFEHHIASETSDAHDAQQATGNASSRKKRKTSRPEGHENKILEDKKHKDVDRCPGPIKDKIIHLCYEVCSGVCICMMMGATSLAVFPGRLLNHVFLFPSQYSDESFLDDADCDSPAPPTLGGLPTFYMPGPACMEGGDPRPNPEEFLFGWGQDPVKVIMVDFRYLGLRGEDACGNCR